MEPKGIIHTSKLVGNKARGWISKRLFQENKARQIFRKNERFLSLDTRTYVRKKNPASLAYC